MNLVTQLESWLQDEKITDICINADGRAFIDRGQGLERPACEDAVAQHSDAAAQLKAWILDRLSQAGRSWDARHPFADAPVLPAHRLHVAFPPVSGGGPALSLRRLGRTLAAPPEERWKTSLPSYRLLREATNRGESIVLAGATGSGKTTLLNDLLSAVPSNERLIALEDTPELFPRHPHFVSLQSRAANADGFGEVTIRQLLRQSLRMRPDRILLGECRGSEVLDLLQVLNTGHRGSLATVHANSARDAVRRIETLALLSAPESFSHAVLREWIASGIQWIAHLDRLPDGSRRIREVARVQGIDAGVVLLRPMAPSVDVAPRAVV